MEKLTKETIKNTYTRVHKSSILFQILNTADHYGIMTQVDLELFGKDAKYFIIVKSDGLHATSDHPKSKNTNLTFINKYQLIEYLANYKRNIIKEAKQTYHTHE